MRPSRQEKVSKRTANRFVEISIRKIKPRVSRGPETWRTLNLAGSRSRMMGGRVGDCSGESNKFTGMSFCGSSNPLLFLI